MESLKKIVEKLEAPLLFALENECKRLPRIKNLETVMTSLLHRLIEEHQRKPQWRHDEIDRLSSALLKLFVNFDNLPQQQKQHRLTETMVLISTLKALAANAKAITEEGRPSMLQHGEELSPLSLSVESVRGVGPRVAQLLARKSLTTVEDLLFFLPRRYEDRRTVCRITETVPGILQTVSGRITLADMQFYGKRRIFEVTIDDGHGILKAKWFKGREAFLRSTFKPEKRIILTGKVSGFPFEREMIHPDFEIIDDTEDQLLHFKRIVPVYSETDGLQQKVLRRIMWHVVRDYAPFLESPIPEEIRKKYMFMKIREAVRQVHFPDVDQEIDAYREGRSNAHKSLIYDEFFFFQLGMAMRKKDVFLEKGIAFRLGGEMLNRFYKALPFELTQAQQRVISEIQKDMTSFRSMSRLIQGDVGSGKTIVSMAAMIMACESRYQAAIMAPTEILAEQHYRNLKIWSDNIGLKVELITGSLKDSEKRNLHEQLRTGHIDIAVGTHALIQEGVVFRNLGLVVVDEQHRFGVVQRSLLRKKGTMPDLLVMTATPIPRTLAMTIYGDLDVSIIDELPPGKKEIKTKVFSESQRNQVYNMIRREVQKGHQIFIVYPLVVESENLDLKDATRMSQHLQKDIFPEYHVGLIHGRMQGAEKERVMGAFLKKELQILVSTTVIEVGIDVPKASLMIIEHAERFGLSQLHQLRGRVGRSDIPSFCILLVHNGGLNDARKRLKIMEETNDGFRIAEEDLIIRGPGELMGTKQAGFPDFRVANLIRDGYLLKEAREDAFSLVEDDPLMEKPGHQSVREELLKRWKGRLDHVKNG